MTRPAKPLNSQLNLLLVDAPKAVVPDDKQKELALALVELLVSERRREATGPRQREVKMNSKLTAERLS